VIDFWATWCGPCKAISPVLEKFALLVGNDPKVDVRFYKVDIDALEEVASISGISVVRRIS
jgi:thioredoxin 1